MKFPSIKIPPYAVGQQWISRPLVPIAIKGRDTDWEGLALLDSGADQSLFNIEIAKQLGIDLSKSTIEHFRGIEGGKIATFLTSIEMRLLGSSESITIIAGFTNSPSVSAILGRDGFFDYYRIKFEQSRNVIEITK